MNNLGLTNEESQNGKGDDAFLDGFVSAVINNSSNSMISIVSQNASSHGETRDEAFLPKKMPLKYFYVKFLWKNVTKL